MANPAAGSAPPSTARDRRARTPRPENATPPAGLPDAVPTAEPLRRAPRGVRVAPNAPTTGSDHFRGIPVWDPSYTVVELATGECHGTFDSEAEVAACLAFAKLSRDQVEIVPDTSPMARLTGWT